MERNDQVSRVKLGKKGGDESLSLGVSRDIRERLRRATELENPYRPGEDRRSEISRRRYERELEKIIQRDYYPDLEYMSRNKDDFDNVRTFIDDPPGTLKLNEFQSLHGTSPHQAQMNIAEFQSKYTHRGHLSLLAMTNESLARKKDQESWIDKQSLEHNLKRELNILRARGKSGSGTQDSPFDEKSLVLSKSQARSPFMFPYYARSDSQSRDPESRREKTAINRRNTRFNLADGFEAENRILASPSARKSRNTEDEDQAPGPNPGPRSGARQSSGSRNSLLLRSPLVKNALRRSRQSGLFVDRQLRDSYSYKGKSRQSLSRVT
ncbi:hypothetical protein HWI79_3381 [Cryptosporidium felis]|nr:hypothetical protein HWI79_3381 [Cryptosporidium felis]